MSSWSFPSPRPEPRRQHLRAWAVGLLLAFAVTACTSIGGESLGDDSRQDGSGETSAQDAATGLGDQAQARAGGVQDAPADMTLAAYYREIVGAPDELATCLAEAADAESLQTVADLQTAEANRELVERLASRQDACIE